MVKNKNIEIINNLLEDQINKTREILITDKGCKDLDETYTDFTLKGDLNKLTSSQQLNLQREAYYYYDIYRIDNLKSTPDYSTPIIKCRLHNGYELEANSYRFRNVQSNKSVRNILIQSNGDITTERETTIKESRQKYLKYKNFKVKGNIFTKEFIVEASGDKQSVGIAYKPGTYLTKKLNSVIHTTYQEPLTTRETIKLSGSFSHFKILDFTIKRHSGIFSSGTLVLEDLDTNKSRIVIKAENNQITINTYSRKGRKTNLLDGTHNFNELLDLLEPDTSKIDCPYLRNILINFTQGVSATLINGNNYLNPRNFDLSILNELDYQVSEEIKQVKSESLVPALIETLDEFFIREKTKNKIIRKG